jgi:transposase
MDRDQLEVYLSEGLSLAAIGRRHDLHEATVSYWVKKHGLKAAHHAKHAARGGVTQENLAELVAAGMSAAQIAKVVGRSTTTVRHWLREYGLSTQWAERRKASREGRPRLELDCQHHGRTVFRLMARGGYRCGRCQSEAVTRRRRKVKQILVEEAGGECIVCGYSKCIAALEFHHLDPSQKRYTLSHRGVTRSLAKARSEASKCVLLCGNCHAEVEAGLISLAQAPVLALQ